MRDLSGYVHRCSSTETAACGTSWCVFAAAVAAAACGTSWYILAAAVAAAARALRLASQLQQWLVHLLRLCGALRRLSGGLLTSNMGRQRKAGVTAQAAHALVGLPGHFIDCPLFLSGVYTMVRVCACVFSLSAARRSAQGRVSLAYLICACRRPLLLTLHR